MINRGIQGILVLAIALSAPHAFAIKKLADEAGGGATGGSGGAKGGTNSAAGVQSSQMAQDKATKEVTGVIRNETKKQDQKIQNNNGK